jgi:methionyl-tRNA formyltransferase
VARIGVAATAPFGADVLERLAARHEIAFCLTRPDRPQGRGRILGSPPAKARALELGVTLLQPERLDEAIDLPAATIVCVAYGRLIPSALLERHLWLNVHPSLLPRWRGPAPVERAIMAGDTETGVTIIKLVEALDAGPIAAQRAFPIEPDDDAGSVYEKAASLSIELVEVALDDPVFVAQRSEGATYAPKITSADRELDVTRPAEESLNRVRALSPHIGARAIVDGRRLTIWRARIEHGVLVPVEVQPEGRRRMTYEEFLRGIRA